MYRIGLKFPCNGLNRVKKHGCSKLYLTPRYYETRARIKCETDGRLCRDVKFMSRYSGLKYSTDSAKSGKSKGSGVTIAIGALGLGCIGLFVYGKLNPEFQATLEGYLPFLRGSDDSDRKELSIQQSLPQLQDIKETIVKTFFGEAPQEKPAPQPAFKPLVEKKEQPSNEPFAEIRLSKDKGEDIQVVAEKPTPPPETVVPTSLLPASVVELETLCGEAASKAIAAYKKAKCAMQEYNQDVIKVVESSGSTISNAVWERLKKATEDKKAALKAAEEHAIEATKSLKEMFNLLDEPKLEAPSHVKTAARRNIRKILDDVDEAKKQFEEELRSSNIAERYWKQVKSARENFNEELQILFPDINIHEKKLSVAEDAFDLFILHMYNKISNLQRELEKLRTVNEAKVKAALKASGEGANQEKLDALICQEIEKERHILDEQFSKKVLEEQKKFDEDLRRQLKLQSQVHADHLREALLAQEAEVRRQMNRALSEQAEADSVKYKAQLASIVGRLRGLEAALKDRLEEEKGASNAQILWSACQALSRAVKSAPPGAAADKAVRPLEPEIKAVSRAAPKEDPLVLAAIQGIPEEAAKRGVFPEDALRERFLKVESVARRLALVPEQGASLPVYLLSYLQSLLIINNANPIPKSELEDEPIDVQSLNTYDILHRARYWLDRGDFKMTLRYMNLLKGAPRSIARDWMNETRILLETQQAVDTLLAYAGATGLVFLGAGDSVQAQK